MLLPVSLSAELKCNLLLKYIWAELGKELYVCPEYPEHKQNILTVFMANKNEKEFFMEYAFFEWLIGDILIPAVTIGISLVVGFLAGRLYENRKLAKLKKNADKNIIINNLTDVNKR